MDTGAQISGYMQISVIRALKIYKISSLEGPKRLYMEHVDSGTQNSWNTYLLVRGALEIHELLIKGPPMDIHIPNMDAWA